MSHLQQNDSIRCDVKNCVYNDGRHNCTAGQIEVGAQFSSSTADTSSQTLCATFRPR